MPTTVRLEDEVKRELDRLQGELLAERGERISHSELLARLLRFARRDDRFFGDEGADTRPSPRDVERLLARVPDVRVRTRVRDLDRDLYSERP